MSDFDKEAERQKLREKYDRDREKRKETERMSQLLLQGATMTNRHCGTCGDPLFRYEGNEFCATCEGQAEETAAEEAASADPDASAEGAADTGGVDPTENATDSAAPDVVDGDAAGHPSPEQVAGDDGAAAASAPAETRQPTAGSTESPSSPTPTTGATGSSTGTRATDDGRAGGDLDAARASLVRTLTVHAQRAEAADGPRRAADHLAAVREAAEALSALDESRR